MRTYMKFLKCQVKNHSKIANAENTPKSKTSRFDFSKTWRGKWENIIDTMSQTSSLLKFIMKEKRVVHYFNRKVSFSTII